MQKLETLDVTQGTQVSLATGFQIADAPGVFFVPSGALLLAPNVTVRGPLTFEADGSSIDFPFK